MFSWGSNKYGQLYSGNNYRLSSLPASTGICFDANDIIFPSSYCTLFLTKKVVPPQQIKKPQMNNNSK